MKTLQQTQNLGGVKQGEETVTDVVSQGGYSSVKVALQGMQISSWTEEP